jgi:hypothetical protein
MHIFFQFIFLWQIRISLQGKPLWELVCGELENKLKQGLAPPWSVEHVTFPMSEESSHKFPKTKWPKHEDYSLLNAYHKSRKLSQRVVHYNAEHEPGPSRLWHALCSIWNCCPWRIADKGTAQRWRMAYSTSWYPYESYYPSTDSQSPTNLRANRHAIGEPAWWRRVGTSSYV